MIIIILYIISLTIIYNIINIYIYLCICVCNTYSVEINNIYICICMPMRWVERMDDLIRSEQGCISSPRYRLRVHVFYIRTYPGGLIWPIGSSIAVRESHIYFFFLYRLKKLATRGAVNMYHLFVCALKIVGRYIYRDFIKY